jgi:hypothetical protein
VVHPAGENELPALLLLTLIVLLASALTRAERARESALRERANGPRSHDPGSAGYARGPGPQLVERPPWG